MYIKGKRVTLENINSLLEGYSLDIQDEVRSMILDGLDLSKWIEVCSDNPYRLNQIRLATKEGLNPHYFTIVDGRILYKLRKLYQKGFNIEELQNYVGKGFTEEQWDYLISWAENGLLDNRLNLIRTPTSMWSYIDKGLKRSLPMWIFTTGRLYSDRYMKSVLTLMSKGVSADKYVKESWDIEVLEKLAEFSSRRWFNSIVDSVYNFITLDFLSYLGKIASKGKFDYEFVRLGREEDSNIAYYLYQSYHLKAIYTCVSKGYDFSSLLDYNLSSNEVDSILADILDDSKKSFKGRL